MTGMLTFLRTDYKTTKKNYSKKKKEHLRNKKIVGFFIIIIHSNILHYLLREN